MADANAKVGIVINADDKTSPAFNSAGKGADRLKKIFEGLGKHINTLPDAAGKASAALLLLQSSTSKMGAGVADVVNKVGALVALTAVGGPLGLGIAAVTAVVAIGATVWDTYRKSANEAKDALKAQRRVLKEAAKAAVDMTMRIKDLQEAFINQGRAAIEVSLEKAAIDVQTRKAGMEMLELDLKRIDIQSRSSRISAEERKGLEDQLVIFQELFKIKKKELDLAIETEEVLGAIAIDERTKTEMAAAEQAESIAKAAAEKRRAREETRKADNKKLLDEIAKSELEFLAVIDAARERAHRANEARRRSEFNENVKRFNEQKANERRAVQAEQDADKARQAERVENAKKTAADISSISGSVSRALISDDENVKRAALSSAIDVAQQRIVALAASGAASAFEGSVKQFGPIFGPIVGAVAGAAVLAAILAFRSKISLAQGGAVTGGVPGKDSVPAMLRPGERVFTPEQMRDGAGPGGGGGVTNNISFGMLVPDVTGMRKAIKLIDRETRKAKRVGVTGLATA